MNVTLPCILLTSANGISVDMTILILLICGILSNLFMIGVGYFASQKESSIIKGVYMLNCSGYNIGNFALTFIQGFFPGLGVAYLCAFDVGNALMGLGITYAIADHVASGEKQFELKQLIRKLFSSIPFDVYLIVFILALLKISIPTPILTMASTIGAGNAFLAMLMIGILLEVKIPFNEIRGVIKVIGLRLMGMIMMSFIIFLLPLPMLAKKILVIAISTPLSTVSAVFSKRIGYDGDLPAATNSVSIIIGVFVMTVLLMLFV
jgi:Predicted permeases